MQQIYDVAVIGGGASGMMAAIFAARNGAKVVLIEKNKNLGRKLLITGGGRCNITNAEFDTRILLKNFGDAEKFLYSAFAQYGVKDTIEFFEDLKLPIKVEAKNRAFPLSNKASDVVNVLTDELDRLEVEVMLSSPVTKIAHSSSTIYSINCGNRVYKANQYIVATGGISRPETGSTGDGFNWLRQLGHIVKTPTPSITPLATKGVNTALATGTTAKNIHISFYQNNKKAFRLDGNILFTHFGISGPLILNNAYRVAELLLLGPVTAQIDFFPEVDHKTLDINIVNTLNQNGGKQAKNAAAYLAPEGLGALIKDYLSKSIDLNKKSGEISKVERKAVVDALKNFSLEIEKLMGADRAVVADGGVSLKEIDTRTFKSNKVNNLFITGDLLDINRPSGGYSLQLCWTSGYIAGLSASES
jgi:predicted Rossmann fold flavoprotein